MTEPETLLFAKLSSARQTVLKDMTIDELSPGPLLTNIDRMIDAIGAGVRTTSACLALPIAMLAKLNESMVDPLPHELKRPQLRSFPTLMGLFLLLRATGLAVGEIKPKRVVLIDPEMLEQWRSLNPTERYFTLLASLFYEADWACVGLRSPWIIGMQRDVRDAYLQLSDRITILDDGDPWIMHRIETSVSLSLLHQFGWIQLTHNAKPKPGKATTVREIHRTDIGDAMFVATCQIDSDRSQKELQATMQSYFPTWKETLQQPSTEFRQGHHTFKVSFGEAWRRIVAPADANLEHLADAILDAYKFDNDHLYEFVLRNSKGSKLIVAGPYNDDADYFADEMRVGEVPLLVGHTMIFHFDFGDDWEFDVTLESVDEIDAGKTNAIKVTAKRGRAPKQYSRGDW